MAYGNVKLTLSFSISSNFKLSFHALHKKVFPLRISSANVNKSAVSCVFGHIYWKNPNGKTHVLCNDATLQYLQSDTTAPDMTSETAPDITSETAADMTNERHS